MIISKSYEVQLNIGSLQRYSKIRDSLFFIFGNSRTSSVFQWKKTNSYLLHCYWVSIFSLKLMELIHRKIYLFFNMSVPNYLTIIIIDTIYIVVHQLKLFNNILTINNNNHHQNMKFVQHEMYIYSMKNLLMLVTKKISLFLSLPIWYY
jgi:hypothetical protein